MLNTSLFGCFFDRENQSEMFVGLIKRSFSFAGHSQKPTEGGGQEEEVRREKMERG